MAIICADQLIYANVEKDRSPRGLGGFQTLVRTPGRLTEQEILEIEGHFFFGSSTEGGPKSLKRLYFRIFSGKVVVAQAAQVDTIDIHGRSGLFMAHALIFTPENMAAIGDSPFPVFDAFQFETSINPEYIERNTPPDLPQVSLNIAPSECHSEPELQFEPQTLRSLLLLAGQARRLSEGREGIALYGEERAAFDFLQALFLDIPSPLRIHCTFDTNFSAGMLSKFPYWAFGLPRSEPLKPNYFVLDLPLRQFRAIPVVRPISCWETWVNHANTDLRTAAAAYPLCEWLDGRMDDFSRMERDADIQWFGELLRSVTGDNFEIIDRRMQSLLEPTVGPGLAKRIAPKAREWLLCEGFSILLHAGSGPNAQLVHEWVEAIPDDVRLTTAELRDLLKYGKQVGDNWICMKALRWTREWRAFSEVVHAQNNADFSRTVQWALGTVSASITLAVSQTETGVIIGPRLKCPENMADEAESLVCALLNVTPSTSREGSGRMRGIFGFPRRAEADETVRREAAIDPVRMTEIVQQLLERIAPGEQAKGVDHA